MSDTIRIPTDVETFVAAVRAHFADLDPDEREELLDGLAADMSDLVDERGPDALGDPGAYAAELRSAAGLAVTTRSTRRTLLVASPRADEFLDNRRTEWERLATSLPGGAWEFLTSLRPFWWLLRAWVAVELIDLAWGDASYGRLDVIPSLLWVGMPLLTVAAVISVQIGREKVWPGPRRGMSRVALLALNLFALALLPMVVGSLVTTSKMDRWYGQGNSVAQDVGLSFKGRPVRNIYPYDAAGKPLVGVQLVDENGRRLDVDSHNFDWGSHRTVPWLNGRAEAWNVFPLSEQPTRQRNGRPTGVAAQQPAPYDVLPPVTSSGVTPSELAEPKVVRDDTEQRDRHRRQERQRHRRTD